MSHGGAVLSAAREVQIPILAALLMCACVAKARRLLRTRSANAALGPTVVVPPRIRKPAVIGICTSELALAVGLVLTAGQAGAGVPAATVRALTALLFGIAVAALYEMRISRPDAGCGCFGELSDTPVGMRAVARSGVLCAGAIASIGVPPLRWPASTHHAGLLLVTGAAELLLLAALSPEISEVMVRLGYREPCEATNLAVARTLKSLRASKPWRLYAPHFTTREPSDVWREGCWRFATYPAVIDGRKADVVFAIYLKPHRPPVRAAVVDATTDMVPAGIAVPVRSDAEILAQSSGETEAVVPPRWIRPKSPTFTPAVVPTRAHPPARAWVPGQAHGPARGQAAGRASAHPLAHAVPRESGHVLATAPEAVMLRQPRFLPNHETAQRGNRDGHGS